MRKRLQIYCIFHFYLAKFVASSAIESKLTFLLTSTRTLIGLSSGWEMSTSYPCHNRTVTPRLLVKFCFSNKLFTIFVIIILTVRLRSPTQLENDDNAIIGVLFEPSNLCSKDVIVNARIKIRAQKYSSSHKHHCNGVCLGSGKISGCERTPIQRKITQPQRKPSNPLFPLSPGLFARNLSSLLVTFIYPC